MNTNNGANLNNRVNLKNIIKSDHGVERRGGGAVYVVELIMVELVFKSANSQPLSVKDRLVIKSALKMASTWRM